MRFVRNDYFSFSHFYFSSTVLEYSTVVLVILQLQLLYSYSTVVVLGFNIPNIKNLN